MGRETQANSMANGPATDANSNVSAMVIADNLEIWPSGRDSPESPYGYVGASDLQQFEWPQRHKA